MQKLMFVSSPAVEKTLSSSPGSSCCLQVKWPFCIKTSGGLDTTKHNTKRALFTSLSWGGGGGGGSLARETKGSGNKGFPVLDSGTSSLYVRSHDVSIYCMGELWVFVILLKISLFQIANKKIELV